MGTAPTPRDPDRIEALIEQHGAQLSSEAEAVLREHPGVDPVALIVDAKSPAGAAFVESARAQLGAVPALFVGVMPRRLALDHLREDHTSLLDWLADSRPPDGRRVLPVIALMGTEAELGAIDLDLSL